MSDVFVAAETGLAPAEMPPLTETATPPPVPVAPPAPVPVAAPTPPGDMLTFEVAYAPKPPIPFQLTVQTADGGTETHTFTAIGNPGAGGQLAIAAFVKYREDGKQVLDLSALLRFFNRVLASEDDYNRLYALVDRKDVTFDMDVLGGIYAALIEKYSAGR